MFFELQISLKNHQVVFYVCGILEFLCDVSCGTSAVRVHAEWDFFQLCWWWSCKTITYLTAAHRSRFWQSIKLSITPEINPWGSSYDPQVPFGEEKSGG